MSTQLTAVETRALGDRLAGVLDGDVDEAVRWVAPVVAQIIEDRLGETERTLFAASGVSTRGLDEAEVVIARVCALLNTPDDTQEWEHPSGEHIGGVERVEVIRSDRIRAALGNTAAVDVEAATEPYVDVDGAFLYASLAALVDAWRTYEWQEPCLTHSAKRQAECYEAAMHAAAADLSRLLAAHPAADPAPALCRAGLHVSLCHGCGDDDCPYIDSNPRSDA